MKIVIVNDKISESELREIAKEFYIDMIKGAIDVEKEIVAFGGEWHMDANNKLIENGSKQNNIWGFNIYFNKLKEERLEYFSLINIRPGQGNRGMEIEDENLRKTIKEIIDKIIVG